MSIDGIERFLTNISPSFRRAREERNLIKTKYRRNIRNIESGEAVETLAGYETHLLGDYIESLHKDIETRIMDVGEDTISRTLRRGRGLDSYSAYSIPDDYREEIKENMEKVVTLIRIRNYLSLILAFFTYITFLVFLLAIIAMLSNNLDLLLP